MCVCPFGGFYALRLMCLVDVLFTLMLVLVKDEFFPEKEGDLQKALGVVLDLLDYSSWRSNLAVWNHLMNIIKRLRMK